MAFSTSVPCSWKHETYPNIHVAACIKPSEIRVQPLIWGKPLGLSASDLFPWAVKRMIYVSIVCFP
ncbi:hypothetical protein MTR_1g037740 [Medicago truncatula]|uniref:Uncharacterized protein n=1 Tax=Medicago truncatula TaxID=3880 RepID=A0A072VHP9_MEDTR|nr:hypothetical protein MTR_1g037740 [Medicago truncatula]